MLPLLAAVTFFVGVLTGGAWLLDKVMGPDPDLVRDPEAPMCKCGVRDGARFHVHPSWTERDPRRDAR